MRKKMKHKREGNKLIVEIEIDLNVIKYLYFNVKNIKINDVQAEKILDNFPERIVSEIISNGINNFLTMDHISSWLSKNEVEI